MAKNNVKFAFIGSGNMGSAIIRGFVSRSAVFPESVVVCNRRHTNYPMFQQMGLRTAETIEEAVSDANYIFLCVKPKDIREIVAECCRAIGYKRSSVFISIAAAVPISLICDAAGFEVPVIRSMPGMPMIIGEGTIAICKNALVDNKTFAYICRLFSSIAMVSVQAESNLNSIISVNGSSPAYVYLFIKAMLDGAVKQGITADQALPLILRTIIGSAKMVEQSELPIEEQIRRICSPGGTTLAAMKILEEEDMVGTIVRAMEACTERADEISEELKS